MENLDMPLFLMHWDLFASVERPYSDTLGWPENAPGVLEFYDWATQRRIQGLVKQLAQTLFCADANGDFGYDLQTIDALEQCGFEVSFALPNSGDRYISGSVARDDRCLHVSIYN